MINVCKHRKKVASQRYRFVFAIVGGTLIGGMFHHLSGELDLAILLVCLLHSVFAIELGCHVSPISRRLGVLLSAFTAQVGVGTFTNFFASSPSVGLPSLNFDSPFDDFLGFSVIWFLFMVALSHFIASPTIRRVDPTKCRSCKYNLTGNVTGRCPECGAPVPAKNA